VRTRDKRLLSALQNGAVIMVEHTPDRTTYRLSSTNRPIHAKRIDRMLREGLIEPNGDGLFGDTQTYRAAPPPSHSGQS
jgi:hypothetical protein